MTNKQKMKRAWDTEKIEIAMSCMELLNVFLEAEEHAESLGVDITTVKSYRDKLDLKAVLEKYAGILKEVK